MKKGRLFVLLSSLLFTVGFAETKGDIDKKPIYKWEENGMINYSHIKPLNVKNFIKLDSSGREIEDYTEGFGTIEQVIVTPKKSNKMAELTLAGESQRQEEKSEKAIKEKNCEVARKNLATVNTGEVWERDSQGNLVRLSKEQIQAKREKIERDVNYFCSE